MHGARPDASCYLSLRDQTYSPVRQACWRSAPSVATGTPADAQTRHAIFGIAAGNRSTRPSQNAQRAAPQRRTTSRSGEQSRRTRQAANPAAQAPANPPWYRLRSARQRRHQPALSQAAPRAPRKTDAPIMSTPGSVAVITREEMDSAAHAEHPRSPALRARRLFQQRQRFPLPAVEGARLR